MLKKPCVHCPAAALPPGTDASQNERPARARKLHRDADVASIKRPVMRLTAFACFPCEFPCTWYCNSRSITQPERNMDNAVVNVGSD